MCGTTAAGVYAVVDCRFEVPLVVLLAILYNLLVVLLIVLLVVVGFAVFEA